MRAKTMLWLATCVGAACFSEPPVVLPEHMDASTNETQPLATAGSDGADSRVTEGSAPDTGDGTGGPVTPDTDDGGSISGDTGEAPPACGNRILEGDEDCDDGNRRPGDGCSAECRLEASGCSGSAMAIGENVEQGIAVCGDPQHRVCEEDFVQLCAPGWHLCSPTEHMAKNDAWAVDLLGQRALGAIRCRAAGGAGHYTVLTTATDGTDNCEIGSSRPSCPSAFGCNETNDFALCCARLPRCGDGIVDPPFEECDDANFDEDDDCTADCTATFGTGPYC